MGTEYGGSHGRGYSGGTGEGYGETRYGDEYGSNYGGGFERGEGRYRDTTEGYSQRSNYPGGYRSGETYGQSGRSYGDYDRGSYGEGRRYGQGRGYEGRDWSQGRGYEGRGGYEGRAGYEGRGYEGRERYGEGEERGWWDRFSDTVASWFGDEEAERRRRMDRPYEGRGPKGYRRSDDRIREDINDRLSEGYLDATDVEVSVSGGEVVLSGTVNSRMDKRRAEAIAEHVSGVQNVENRLRVRQQYGSTYGTSEGTSSMGTAATGTGTPGTTGTTDSGTGTTGTGTSATGTTGGTGTSSTSARGKTASS
jgi:osmotically-inducible protein OsmY